MKKELEEKKKNWGGKFTEAFPAEGWLQSLGSLIAISEESSSKTEEINKIFEELDKNFRELKMDVSIDKLKTVLQIP